MLFSSIAALAMANLAAAQALNNTPIATPSGSSTGTLLPTDGTGTTDSTGGTAGPTGTRTDTTPSASGTNAPGNGPATDVDGFVYFGCIFSEDGFPGFELVSTSPLNSIKFCARQCDSRFFGVYDENCYCGGAIDPDTTTKVPDDQCDISCPGEESESCGGDRTIARMLRRQSVAASVLLSVYISTDAIDTTATVDNTATVENTAIVTRTADGELTTEVVTATVTNSDGDVVTTVLTNTLVVVPTGVTIICYGDYCAPEFHCPVCTRYQVVCRDGSCCPEECHGDDWNQLVICEGDNCHYSVGNCDRKITCQGDSCNVEEVTVGKNLVCTNGDCCHESCTGDECWKKETCDGEHCTVDTPCTGPGCPTPQPNVPTPGKVVYVPNVPNAPGAPGSPGAPGAPGAPGSPGAGNTAPGAPGGGATAPAVPGVTTVPNGSGVPGVSPSDTPYVVVSGSGKKAASGLAALIAGAVFVM
ncbi:hypothetical protein EDB80DRAFT_188089 [Ilyonectria destructans]|nr:hypothetical protein EDB80DRAFT_188089 [Ilyonectria destructans]